MSKRQFKHLRNYLIILGLSLLFFGIIDLMSYQNNPIDQRSYKTNFQLLTVVIIFSLVLFLIVDFFFPYYRKRLIKKLHKKLAQAEITEPSKLTIKATENIFIVFHAVEGFTERNEVVS